LDVRIPRAPTLAELHGRQDKDPEAELRIYTAAVGAAVRATTPDGKYRHWHTLRRLSPPEGLTPDEHWFATKVARRGSLREIPLRATDGQAFKYALPDAALEMLHKIDSEARGNIAVSEVVTNAQQSSRYVINSLIEEAITSSQLEGASTTRVVAKEMLRSGRAPRDTSEQMILNNFRAIRFVGEHRDDRLTPELVLELHRIVTEDTLDDENHAGRLQTPDETRAWVEDNRGEVVHTPPPAEQSPARLEAMCDFANGVDAGGPAHFDPPIVRAILLHLWLAYDHPFADGNGRTARALFYWSMLHQGYWLAEYLSISRILRAAPARYGKSFVYVETDEYDATYFVLSQLKVICRAIDDLMEYLAEKMAEVQRLERSIRQSVDFNHRQIALIGHALRHPFADYTMRSHAMSHGVTHESARKDLTDLVRRGLFERRRVRGEYHFRPVPDLAVKVGADAA
jgi:Fic family protein